MTRGFLLFSLTLFLSNYIIVFFPLRYINASGCRSIDWTIHGKHIHTLHLEPAFCGVAGTSIIIPSFYPYAWCLLFGWKPQPNPWHPYIYPKSLEGLGRSSIPSTLHWELPQFRLHPQESSPNDDHSPGILKTTPTGYLNCSPENKHVVFQSFLPFPLWGTGNSSRSIGIH